MGKVTKLLNRPLKAFTIYSIFILVCSIPVYYLAVEYFWMHELDEHNVLIKERIESRLGKEEIVENELDRLISNWTVIQPRIILEQVGGLANFKDSIYERTIEQIDDNQIETNRFRCLKTKININNQAYLLTIESDVEEVDETLFIIALLTILFFVFLVAGFILLNRKIAKKVWLPFSKTLDKLKNFDLSRDQKINFDKTEIEEFDELNSELTKLIEKNITIYNEQKVFIENASHELQTPIAVLKSKIEMLLQSENLTKEQADIIDHINAPLARVNRINKNLLLLAKIENNQFLEKEEIDIHQLVIDNVALLEDYIHAKSLKIEINCSDEIKVKANRNLTEIVLNNLIINAIIHSESNCEIEIQIIDNQLLIMNAGLSALKNEKLFRRFAVVSSSTSNSGLGLAIANEICLRYNWQLSYAFKENRHQFKVQF